MKGINEQKGEGVMKRKLLIYPAPALRWIADPVTDEFGSDWLKKLVQDMEHIINTNEIKGVGLAATQIGVNKAVIIYRDRAGTVHALCNPKIIARFGIIRSYDESCLSLPEFKVNIKRSKGVKVKAQTVDGKGIIIKERGFQAIILQHEIDHLHGMILTDRDPDRNKVAHYIIELFKKEGVENG